MPMPASEIETLIKAAFPDADVVIEDLRGDGDHYACRVVSTAGSPVEEPIVILLDGACACMPVVDLQNKQTNK